MPCVRCRTCHYRCDGEQPTCGRCEHARKACVYESGRRFQRSSIQKALSRDQSWVSLPAHVQFVDESDEVRSQYAANGSCLFNSPSTSKSPSHLGSSAGGKDHYDSSIEGITVPSLLNPESPERPQLCGVPPVLYDNHLRTQSWNQEGINTYINQQPRKPPILWPLEHEQEAMLLQHYINDVAQFFDQVDNECHFGVCVVQRARKNSTLMNAILALSARQLNRTTSFDTYIADAYYQRCFKTLIPELDGDAALTDESLLAASIILRLLEEMNVSVIGSDPQGHLFGTQAIIRAAEQSYATTTGPSFRQAIYWAAFRQELFISLMTQRAFSLHIFPADRSLEVANDSTWATRTIAHLGDVGNFAFGEGRHSISRYSQLMDENKAWRERRPESFDPFYYRQDRDGSGRNFPDIRYHEKYHVMGIQYNILAHILLVVHDPAIPQIGLGHKRSRAVVASLVQDDVRKLCGVAMSNPKVFPAKFVACFAIALVGDRFTVREDQETLRDLWHACERSHGFPPTATIGQLEESWGWH